MNRLLSFLVAFGIGIGHADAMTYPEKQTQSAASAKIISGDFGLFNLNNPQGPSFTPASVVPFIENQAYGWVIRLQTSKPTVKWREELVLPAKPATWGDPEPLGKRSISPSGRASITEREVAPEKGMIFNAWSVAPGDPKGKYVIRVFVDGALVKTFRFEVQ